MTLKETLEVTQNVRSLKASLRKSANEEEKPGLKEAIDYSDHVAKDLKGFRFMIYAFIFSC